MGTYTPKRNLYKPDVGETDWGDKVNANWDILDTHDHVRSEITDFFASPFWDNIPDRPSEFPPSKHADTHTLNGADAIPSDDILLRLQTFNGVFWFNNNWRPSGVIGYSRSGSAGMIWSDYRLGLLTGTTANSYVKVFKGLNPALGTTTWQNKRYFGVSVLVSTYTSQIIHLTTGCIRDPKSESNTYQHVGFKIINGDLYGTVADGSQESVVLLETLTSGKRLKLQCVLIPDVRVEFYVDGIKKGEITQNLPSGDAYAHYLFQASICNTESANKSMHIGEVRILQMEG